MDVQYTSIGLQYECGENLRKNESRKYSDSSFLYLRLVISVHHLSCRARANIRTRYASQIKCDLNIFFRSVHV